MEEYLRTFAKIRQSRERVVIDGRASFLQEARPIYSGRASASPGGLPSEQPQLIVKGTPNGNYDFLAQAWEAANDKARELGWIV